VIALMRFLEENGEVADALVQYAAVAAPGATEVVALAAQLPSQTH